MSDIPDFPVEYSGRLSAHGLPVDQLVSCLQKYIRRGNTEQACVVAYELTLTGTDLAEKVWSRLQVISAEDVGSGTFREPVVVDALYRMWRRLPADAADRWLITVHAIRFLATCTKDRTSDELANWVRREVDVQGRRPTIPDFALDMHTVRGREMGRGHRHFLEEGAHVENEIDGRDLTYRRYLLEVLD